MSNNFVNGIFDRTFRGVQKSLDLNWRRNEAITSNISNAETPQYRAVDLSFSTELERAFEAKSGNTSELKKTDSKHLDLSSNAGAHLKPDLSGVTRADGNNVDIDIQMGKMAYAGGQFSTSAQIIRKKISQLQIAIRMGAN